MLRYVLTLCCLVLLAASSGAAPPSEWVSLGEGYVICKATSGSTVGDNTAPGTDVAHTPTCSLSAADAVYYLRANAVVQACAWFSVTTSASAPQIQIKFKAGAAGTTTLVAPGSVTTLSNNLVGASLALCWMTIISANPGASVPTYSAPLSYYSSVGSATDNNSVIQPVPLVTTGAQVFTITTQFLSDTAGVNTNTLQALTVEIMR